MLEGRELPPNYQRREFSVLTALQNEAIRKALTPAGYEGAQLALDVPVRWCGPPDDERPDGCVDDHAHLRRRCSL